MIRKEDLIGVGKFQRTHALKGELNALIDIDPDFFGEDDQPMIVEMEGCFVPFFAESIRTKGQTSYLVKIDRVDTEEQARQFVNKEIYAERKELKEYMAETGEELIDGNELDGYMVSDTSLGEIGRLLRVDDSTANILLVIEGPDGEEIYLPMAEEFIAEIDPDERKIIMNLPDGLIGLNKKKDD